MSIKRIDGTAEVVVPDGETWKSGEIRQAADGRLGVVALGPEKTGDAGGTVKATLHCAVDLEVEITTSVTVSAGDTPGMDISNQQLVASGAGDKDVRLAVAAAAINGQARVILN